MRNSRTILITCGAMALCIAACGDQQQRPAVQFDHVPHDRALEGACDTCHARSADGAFSPKLKGTEGLTDRAARMELHHDRCIGCHAERAGAGKPTGPRTCARCHRERPTPPPPRAAMRFDSSLHARHVDATGPKACDTCHDKGKPEQVLEGDRDKVHALCVGCHLEAKEAGKPTGPATCAGCHDSAARAGIKRLATPTRLDAGQKDRLWIKTDGASAPGLVAFDHEAHEAATPFCTSCHHETKQKCGVCHTPGKAGEEGGGVALEDAHHQPSSRHSCVGCHEQAAAKKQCAGCHQQLSPAHVKGSCAICHGGKAADAPLPAEAEVITLPPSSEAFPEQIEIKSLARRYRPSKFPHRKIVAALAAGSNRSKLARRFHGPDGTLCAGCHHQSPRGATPPPCSSCHGPKAATDRDQPGLTAAYHRQCIGCHKSMGINKTGCTDCHEEAKR